MARLDLPILLERRATATLLLVSGTLSVLYLVGYDLGYLIAEPVRWQRQPWLLITTTLLHANPLHLAFNLYWLAVFGVAIEGVFGTLRTAALLLVLAASSSAAEHAVSASAIGLSGVGYGLFGFLWAIQRSDPRFRGAIDQQTTLLFVAWFFFCIASTYTGLLPIGNVAHASGALMGGLLGWGCSRARAPGLARFLPSAGFVGLVALACTVGRPLLMKREILAWEYGEEGLEALNADRNERAAELLELAVRTDASERGSWWNLGVARWRLERFEEANEAFDRAVALAPPEGEDRSFLVQLKTTLSERARMAGDAAEAEALLRTALELDPRSPAALNRLAYLREEAGDVDAAIALYEQASDEGSTEGWASQRLVDLKRRHGR